MKKTQIPKRSGGVRTIYVPAPWEKHHYRDVAARLLAWWQGHEDPGVCHAFLPGRSPVTNARAHAGFTFTLCADLKDFFDSITRDHLLRAGLPADLADACLYEGAPRQGLPSSPLAANIAGRPMDARLLAWCRRFGVAYTRYADDLGFSCNQVETLHSLRALLPRIVAHWGFVLNPRKTRLLCARGGARRILTGVAMDATAHPTRAVRRRLRAALHQGRLWSAAGLAEWMKLNLPGTGKNAADPARRLRPVQRHAVRLAEARLHPV